MIKWINFLHLYQPPSQRKEVVDQIVNESYSLIINLLEKYPHVHMTMNISGSLLELLDMYGHRQTIDSFKKFAESGQVELVSSAMYHPVLPLISPSEVKNQIKLHDEISKKYFGSAYQPRGFYLPEMAYSENVEKIIKELGFEWILLDEIHSSEPIDPHIKYTFSETGMNAVFRNHEFSLSFPPEYILANMNKVSDYVITAHDGELYGHWHKNDNGFYEKVFTSLEVKTYKISAYLEELRETREVKAREASWESTNEELALGVPFALWKDPKNEIHIKLWEFAHTIEIILEKNSGDAHIGYAKNYYSKGLASCAWWWASGRKLGAFSPVSWNPTEIERGASFLLNSARSLVKLNESDRIKVEKIFSNLRENIWEKHWLVYNSSSK